jgi:hypothetical protein
MNIYVKDSQISTDFSTLSATRKAQKGKKFFVDLLMTSGGDNCLGDEQSGISFPITL